MISVPNITSRIQNVRDRSSLEANILKFRLQNLGKNRFVCPICGYHGPFRDISLPIGVKVEHERCPRCNSWTRHRLQQLVLNEVFQTFQPQDKRALHFAPEHFFQKLFKDLFRDYVSADLMMAGVDIHCDLTNLPFDNAEFDFICACHVLEHIRDDAKAISEIRRVLKPGGLAIIAVPVIGKETIEYPEPNHYEWEHVRAPGQDYYKRYLADFCEVKQYSSMDFSESYQIFINEDRGIFPNEFCPLRPTCVGTKHIDYVSVCYV